MRKISIILSSLLFVVSVFTSAYSAGDAEAIKKLSSFKKTGIDVVADVIDQNTKFRTNIEKNILPNIKMPAGFKIEIFAVAPDARHMAVSRNKGTVWIGTRKTRVWQATDRDMDNVADTVEQFAPTVNFDIPMVLVIQLMDICILLRETEFYGFLQRNTLWKVLTL